MGDYLEVFSRFVGEAKAGVSGSIGWVQMNRLYDIVRKRSVWTQLCRCFILNIVMVAVYHYIFQWWLYEWLIRVNGVYVATIFKCVYHMIWVIPVYLFGTLINLELYSEIFRRATGRNFTSSGTLDEKLFFLLSSPVLLTQGFLFSFVPYIGWWLGLIYNCWWWSFSVYWYTLSSENTSSTVISQFVEHHWVYFLAFGAPAGLLCSFFTYPVDVGISAFIFPMMIILAHTAFQAGGIPTTNRFPYPFTIFSFTAKVADKVTDIIIFQQDKISVILDWAFVIFGFFRPVILVISYFVQGFITVLGFLRRSLFSFV